MSSSRKLYREQTKKLYQIFCNSWRTELRFQIFQESQGKPLPPGTVSLIGRQRPSYHVWLKAFEEQRARVKKEQELKSLRAQEFERSLAGKPTTQEPIDLEWKED